MAFSIPSLQDIYNKIKVSVYSFTQGALDIEKHPFPRSFADAQSKILQGIYQVSQDSVDQTFAQNATSEAFLLAIAFDRTNNEIRRKDATFATGTLMVTASAEIDIPAGTQFLSDDGELYESLVARTCIQQSFLITSLARVSGYAIATLANHQLGNGAVIPITGAVETTFNGTQTIEVLTADTFRYANAGSDESATGTIMGSFLGARVDVQSINAATSTNKTYTTTLELASTLDADFVENIYITYNGLTGGTDVEELLDFKARLVDYLANPQNKGNRRQHQSWIKQNTDANYAYFFTSEDTINLYLTGAISKIDDSFSFTNFTSDELLAIKTKFISNNQLLLGVDALNLNIVNPTFVSLNIAINDLIPYTIEMQSAINLVLKEYMSLLPIKNLMSSGLTEVSDDKIKQIAALARDSNGRTPTWSSLVVSGESGLDSDLKKAILGTVTYG